MKKNVLLLLASLSLTVTGCNAQIFDTNYQFDKAHLVTVNKCVKISKWCNYEDGDMVQIILKDDTVVLGHSNEIILISGKCPYCND